MTGIVCGQKCQKQKDGWVNTGTRQLLEFFAELTIKAACGGQYGLKKMTLQLEFDLMISSIFEKDSRPIETV